MIQLYSIHDDPTHETANEERWWCAVWAESLTDALDIAAKHYGGDGPEPYRNLLEGEPCQNQERLCAYTPENPGMERRFKVLRLAGWREEGERTCDTCGLASLGIEEYEVCDECGQCKECGCECDAEAAEVQP